MPASAANSVKVLLAAEAVVHEARAQVAQERARDDHEQVAALPTTDRARSSLR